jgi:hypothetical protein
MKCFVISPIGDEGSDVRRHADEVFDHIIEPALAHFSIEPVRSDHMNEPGKISEQMYRAIFGYDLCIAVLTYSNPNVYYELAVAQSACRPVVILIEKGSTLPFDVKDFRSLTYDLTITAYTQKTHIKRLISMLGELKQAGWRGDDVFYAYRNHLEAVRADHAMIKINDMTTFKIPAGTAEGDITIRQLLDEGFEKDKSLPRQRIPILEPYGGGRYVLHRSTIDAFLAPKKHPPDVDESTLTLRDLVLDPKVRDYIINSFMAVAPDETLADAKDLLDKNPLCLDILVTEDGFKYEMVVGWITNVMVLNAATI